MPKFSSSDAEKKDIECGCLSIKSLQIKYPKIAKEWDFHKNILTPNRIKKKFCKQNNILLLIIPYTKYKNIDLILQKWIYNYES